ncbi:MAG: hypothetical protein RLZZ31_248 [Actinomycetota bacterium]
MPSTPSVASEVASTQPKQQRLVGLDGLRAIAVGLVVVYHLWPDVVPAGFLGVSIFFTLSGYVITRAIVSEHQRSGTINLTAFWRRRWRRLWPAATVTLTFVMVIWGLRGLWDSTLAKDNLAAFFQVANWRFLFSGQQYGQSIDASPVLHFWSLAIEEQVYWLLPLAVWAVFKLRTRLSVLWFGLLALAIGATYLWRHEPMTVYFSTLTRVGEIAIGGLAAIFFQAFSQRMETSSRKIRTTTHAFFQLAGVLSLAVLIWLAVTTSLSTSAYFRGGLLFVAVLTAFVLWAGSIESSFTNALSLRPLVYIGAISYAIYLVHWPLNLWFEESFRNDLGAFTPWLVLVLTLLIASVSLRVLELPIREVRWPKQMLIAFSLTLTLVLLTCIAISWSRPNSARDIEFADVGSAQVAVTDLSRSVLYPLGTMENQLSMAVFGDSTATTLTMAMRDGDPTIIVQPSGTELGCPFGRTGQMRGTAVTGDDPSGLPVEIGDKCDWQTKWAPYFSSDYPIDLALMVGGYWDTLGRQVPALGSKWYEIGDPTYDQWLQGEIAAAADSLHNRGAGQVAILTLPYPEEKPNARVDRFNQMIVEIAATRPWMHVIDYGAWVNSLPLSERERLRPDGIHVSAKPDGGTGREVAQRFLYDQLRSITRAGLPS